MRSLRDSNLARVYTIVKGMIMLKISTEIT